MVGRINQQILWLDVSVHEALEVHVRQASQKLVRVQFHKEWVHWLLQLLKRIDDSLYGHRNIVHDDIQDAAEAQRTLLEVCMMKFYNVHMVHFSMDLELTILLLPILLLPLDGNDASFVALVRHGSHEHDCKGTLCYFLLRGEGGRPFDLGLLPGIICYRTLHI